MNEKVNEELLKNADELINRSDRELMALSLNKNEKWAENYQMAMNIKLRKTLHFLNENLNALRKSTNLSSWIMGIMTLLILILTEVIVWKGL